MPLNWSHLAIGNQIAELPDFLLSTTAVYSYTNSVAH